MITHGVPKSPYYFKVKTYIKGAYDKTFVINL